MTILITGASGFVGSAVLQHLQDINASVRPVLRSTASASREISYAEETMLVPTLDANTNWSAALVGVETIVHCAARVHVIHDEVEDPLTEYRRINVEGTLNLARRAVTAGVRRFIFISSIKVNGESTQPGRPFNAEDVPAPEDAYGISKAEAEAGLQQLAHETRMELVIIRPVLVYGPGVKGNFASLLRWLQCGLPLPLGSIKNNRRSLLALDNLVDLIRICINHPRAAGQTFLVSDDEDLSTIDLLQRMSQVIGYPTRLLPVPLAALRLAARVLGKSNMVERLIGSLQVDITKTRDLLGWRPLLTVDEGLRRLMQGRQ